MTMRNGPLPLNNILKTVEIPTPKPYIFLFFVSRSTWWYDDHDHTEWSCPLYTRDAPISWKLLRSSPIDHIYYCSLCQETCDSMWSWQYGVVLRTVWLKSDPRSAPQFLLSLHKDLKKSRLGWPPMTTFVLTNQIITAIRLYGILEGTTVC
jgi:hypothetical protein